MEPRTSRQLFMSFQADRPPSPPRGLRDILDNDELTSDFRTYLSEIDAENEDLVQSNRISFVIHVRKLRGAFDEGSNKDVRTILSTILATHFDVERPSQLIAMDNPELRDECQTVMRSLADSKTPVSDKRWKIIWLAYQVSL